MVMVAVCFLYHPQSMGDITLHLAVVRSVGLDKWTTMRV